MTEPLIVDPERLDSASAILGAAAGKIPTQLPKFSSPGQDPLSLAIAVGAIKVEEPMAALPGIKVEATTVAQNIGIAGQRYTATDQMLAERAQRLQFPTGEGEGGKLIGEAGEGKKEPFSWKPTPTDVALGAEAGIAGAAHDYALGKASKLSNPDSPLLNWTKELKVKGVEIPGFSRAGGLLGVVSAIPSGIVDYAEAKAAGASQGVAVAQAVTREGAGTAAGLIAAAGTTAVVEGTLVTGGGILAAAMGAAETGALIGSVIPGAGTVVGLAAGALVGGAAAFLASKGVAKIWDVFG